MSLRIFSTLPWYTHQNTNSTTVTSTALQSSQKSTYTLAFMNPRWPILRISQSERSWIDMRRESHEVAYVSCHHFYETTSWFYQMCCQRIKFHQSNNMKNIASIVTKHKQKLTSKVLHKSMYLGARQTHRKPNYGKDLGSQFRIKCTHRAVTDTKNKFLSEKLNCSNIHKKWSCTTIFEIHKRANI